MCVCVRLHVHNLNEYRLYGKYCSSSHGHSSSHSVRLDAMFGLTSQIRINQKQFGISYQWMSWIDWNRLQQWKSCPLFRLSPDGKELIEPCHDVCDGVRMRVLDDQVMILVEMSCAREVVPVPQLFD